MIAATVRWTALTLFGLGGSPAASTFPAGQTGCNFAGTQLFPNSAALDPEGNLWVGFGKTSLILRFNNPGAANSTDFGKCQQFVQTVATIPNNRVGAGLAWIGHDLWGASPESVFVIPNADTVCLNGTNPVCTSTNGAIKLALPGIIGATALAGDQFYPAINGNNLYIGLAHGCRMGRQRHRRFGRSDSYSHLHQLVCESPFQCDGSRA